MRIAANDILALSKLETMTTAPATLIDFPREKIRRPAYAGPMLFARWDPRNYSRLRCLVFKEQANSIWPLEGPNFVSPPGATWVLATLTILAPQDCARQANCGTAGVSRSLRSGNESLTPHGSTLKPDAFGASRAALRFLARSDENTYLHYKEGCKGSQTPGLGS